MSDKQLRNKFVLSRMYLTLFVGFLFAALFTLTYTQFAVGGIPQAIYEITIRQILFALVGFTILFLSVKGGVLIFDWYNRHEPSPMDEERGWLIYGLIALFGARVLGGLVTAIPLSTITFLSGSIALTSAIFEEPIFCGIGLMFYVIFLKIFRGNVIFAAVVSTLIVAVLFAAIHIGVYGLSIAVMLYLVVGRIIYNFVFLKTRTMLTSTGAHLGHNFLVAFLGV